MKRIDTPRGPIYVWAPPGASRAAAVVYVHGYYDTAAQAIEKHRLAEQFSKSGRRVTFLVPEAPTGSGQTVHFPDLSAILKAAGLPASTKVVAVAHSGGYRTVRQWLSHPGLRHLILLDAVYAGLLDFEAWGRQPGHTMDVVGQDTATSSLVLAKAVGAPYTPAAAHMGIVTDGVLIPRLIGRAPLPGAGAGGLVAIAVATFVAWGLFKVIS
jgi:hypothetical protein